METLEERFWEKVDRRGPDECWPWIAGHFSNGYGSFRGPHGKTVLAHRLAFELVKGPIPDGMDVLHDCDNPPCCNPVHLWPGTQLDNNVDCASKGRAVNPCGEMHGNAKLTWQKVREMRERYALGGVTQDALGREYGVVQSGVSFIVRDRAWKEVTNG